MVRVGTTLALLVLPLTLGCAADVARGEAGTPPPSDAATWRLVFEEEFSEASWRDRWHLDGFAELSLEKENDATCLKIATTVSAENRKDKQSVLWCRRRFTGDVRIRLRAKGEGGNRSIVLFNANPAAASGYATIFDWKRPDAQYAQYAGNPQWEMYSVGILRDDEAKCNLRYIGGTAAAALKEVSYARFQEETVIRAYDSPFAGRPMTWFEFDISVVGKHITMYVNGAKVVDVADPGNAGAPEYGWTPLADGGWIGIRNFRPNTVWIDSIRVYERPNRREGGRAR